MTDLEFDVLDELYFIVSYPELKSSVQLSDQTLQPVLQSLWEQGYIRCLKNAEEDVQNPELAVTEAVKEFYFLASKAGLLAHNSR